MNVGHEAKSSRSMDIIQTSATLTQRGHCRHTSGMSGCTPEADAAGSKSSAAVRTRSTGSLFDHERQRRCGKCGKEVGMPALACGQFGASPH